MTMTQDLTRAARRLAGTSEELAAALAVLIEAYPHEPKGDVTFKERRLHREATAAHWLKIFAHRHWLTCEFARRRGWKFRREDHFTHAMLADGRKRRRPSDDGSWRGWADHDHFFRLPDGTPAAVASCPYEGAYSPGYLAVARGHGLNVTFPTDFPSWWYPGRTTLVLFEPADTGRPVSERVDAIMSAAGFGADRQSESAA